MIPAIPPGVYTLKATLTGFRTLERKNIERSGRQRQPDRRSRCEVGQSGRNVEVAGGAPLIQTENSAIGTVIENRAIVELPLNGRNYLQLASLIPGRNDQRPLVQPGQAAHGRSAQQLRAERGRPAGPLQPLLARRRREHRPELQLLHAAAVGRRARGVQRRRRVCSTPSTAAPSRRSTSSTKSGSNKLRGTAFEFAAEFRARREELLRPADEPIPPFKRNQYGCTRGRSGGRAEDRRRHGTELFFMFNWEGLRENKSLTPTPSVPLTAWRTGDFSDLRDASGNLIPILRSGDACLRRGRQRAAGADAVSRATVIPANRIHPVSQKLHGLFSAAAAGGDRHQLREQRGADTSMPTSTPTGSISRRASRTGSSGTASRTSSATIRSRSRTWGATPTPTCSRRSSATRARFGSNKLNDLPIRVRAT